MKCPAYFTLLIIDPRGGIARVLVVRAAGRYTRNLRNPVLSKKIIRITVFCGKFSYFRIVQRRKPAFANDRIILSALSGNRERWE